MHEFILKVPNNLFYQNRIKTQYKWKDVNTFIDKQKPLIIVDVKSSHKFFGTSIYNENEAEVVKQLLKYFITEEKRFKDSFWVISPYHA